MSAWSVLCVNYNHLPKNDSLHLTSNHSVNSQMWRKHSRISFREKTGARIQAARTPYTTIWGDHFLSYSSADILLANDDMISHEKLKEEVRSRLLGRPKVSDTLEMIDAIQRLGVDYHFRTEIEQILAYIMEKSKSCLDCDEDHLHTASLKFRIFRQHRYNISCDVFDKFTDSNNKFKDSIVNDARGLLSLYEAAHLRTHGEQILDEALPFTIAHLRNMATELDSPLSNNINNALNVPYYMGMPRLETWKYLNLYEQNVSCNKTILSFAKLDFNLLQKLHQKELSEVTKWWKALDVENKIPFARDRIVECYFWAVGFYFEPEFSLARMILTKLFAVMSLIDDMFDECAPFEELQLFAAATERWNLSEVAHMPKYMQAIYKSSIDLYSEIEEAMVKQGKSYRSHYAIKSMKRYVRGNFIQVNWRHKKHMPTMDEYLRMIIPSIGWEILALTSLLGMGDIVTKHTFEWILTDPKIFIASAIRGRYMDDVADHKFGQKKGKDLSSVECYMNEHNCTMEEAMKELKKRIINLNKDINGEIMQPTCIPLPVIIRFLNFNRAINVIYANEDCYTNAGGLMKDYISGLFVDPIPM